MTGKKKPLAFFCALALLVGSLSACTGGQKSESGGPRIVCTVFPLYDWVCELTRGTPAEITLLADNGIDLHSFQPTVEDLIAIADCDLFLYVGGESEHWAEDALANRGNPDRKTLCLLKILGSDAREEEATEGMQFPKEEPDETEYDEHVWLSLVNAKRFCGDITDVLCTLNEVQDVQYRANAVAYDERLEALDREYRQTVAETERPVLLFADRFPFRYLTEDYGIRYYAAFPGCSTETQASFETVAFLAEKTDELGLNAILTIDGGDGRLAQTVIQNTKRRDQAILSLTSMQSVSKQDRENGASYLSYMKKNLAVLTQALKRN